LLLLRLTSDIKHRRVAGSYIALDQLRVGLALSRDRTGGTKRIGFREGDRPKIYRNFIKARRRAAHLRLCNSYMALRAILSFSNGIFDHLEDAERISAAA
jgi:hypothetical protein